MATIKQSAYGRIRLFNDFTGEEVMAPPGVAHANADGAVWNIGGGFTVKGYLLTDSVCDINAVLDGLNGQILLTNSDAADADAMFVTTSVCFSPAVNAPMILETRVETESLDDRVMFAGFVGVMSDTEQDLVTGSVATLVLTEPDLAGFFYDSQLTTDIEWHMVHNGGTTTGVLDSTLLNSGVTPVVDKMNILRVEIDNNGTARWFIDGVLLKTLAGAVDPDEVFAGCVGVTNTKNASATMAIDYIAVEAERDWTI